MLLLYDTIRVAGYIQGDSVGSSVTPPYGKGNLIIKGMSGIYYRYPNGVERNLDSATAGGAGEANTASNLGGGLANFDSKSGVDLRFNSFEAADFNLAANLLSIDDANWASQTELNLKSPLASPTFTGTVIIPTPFTLGAVSVVPTGTELNYVDGVTSAIQTQLDAKVPTTRTLTINGTTNEVTSSAGSQDLSANRTWTLGLPDYVTVTEDLTISDTLTFSNAGLSGFAGIINSNVLSSTRNWNLPNANGTFAVSATSPLALDATSGALTLTTVPVTKGGTNSTNYTAGSIIFAGASGTSLTEDNTNLFYDDALNRLGLGTASPVSDFHSSSASPVISFTSTNNVSGVRFNVTATATTAFRWQYAGVTYLTMMPSGNFGVGDGTPASLFTVGSGDLFQVGSDGDIDRIKDLPFSWYSTRTGSGFMFDDGAGNISLNTPGNQSMSSSVELFEEWISATATGNLGWAAATTGSGAFIPSIPVNYPSTADSNAFGILSFVCGTASSGRSNAYLNTNNISFEGGATEFEIRMKTPADVTAARDYAMVLGMGDSLLSITHRDAVAFQWVADSSSQQWRGMTSNNGTKSYVTGGSAITASTWYRLRAEVNALGTSVTFYVNGSSIGTITTNIPSDVTARMVSPHIKIVRYLAGTTQTMYVDYFYLKKSFSPTR
jgi:hypothetical protein